MPTTNRKLRSLVKNLAGSVRVSTVKLRGRAVDPLPHLIVHGSHHKVGSLWMRNVLRGVCEEFGWNFHAGGQHSLPRNAHVLFEAHSRFHVETLPPFRGSHLVRDPRDVVVSGYFYHRTCNEPWCLRRREQFSGRSYQQVLHDLSKEEGLAFEMRRVGRSTYNGMLRWSRTDSRFLQVRYEDLIAHEASGFRRIFEHYGLDQELVERCVGICSRFSFTKVTKRSVGQAVEGSHLRSGKVGQWRQHFTPTLVDLSKELYGQGLVELGYESDLGWSI